MSGHPSVLCCLLSSLGITAETIIDKTIELKSIGGVYGNQKPTEFLCLLLKLLQIQPEKEILLEYLQADEFKYVPIVGQGSYDAHNLEPGICVP